MSSPSLDIAIIGAGIAGLSTALALSHPTHRITVYERSQFANEVGAAIVIGVNGTKILRSWGFDFERAGALDYLQMRRIKADTAELDSEEVFEGVADKFGDRWLLFHRADLHSGLRELVDKKSPKPTIKLATPVSSIDPASGTITLTNDIAVTHDLLVVADGSHSQLISTITSTSPAAKPEGYPVRKSPMSMYRFLQPFTSILSPDHPAQHFYANQPSGFTTFYKTAAGRPGLLLNTYPCRGGELLYCALLHPTKPSEKNLEGWDSPASGDDVVSDAQGFHPSIQAICAGASDVKVYTQMWRDPLPTFVSGRAVLVGDAAHLMLPTHGQGASMAIEDAAALGVLFSPSSSADVSPKTVPLRLKSFDTLRLPRVRATQTMSNKMMGDLNKMLDEVKTYYDEEKDGGGKLPGPTAKTYSDAYNEWFFRYDVRKEAERVVRQG